MALLTTHFVFCVALSDSWRLAFKLSTHPPSSRGSTPAVVSCGADAKFLRAVQPIAPCSFCRLLPGKIYMYQLSEVVDAVEPFGCSCKGG